MKEIISIFKQSMIVGFVGSVFVASGTYASCQILAVSFSQISSVNLVHFLSPSILFSTFSFCFHILSFQLFISLPVHLISLDTSSPNFGVIVRSLVEHRRDENLVLDGKESWLNELMQDMNDDNDDKKKISFSSGRIIGGGKEEDNRLLLDEFSFNGIGQLFQVFVSNSLSIRNELFVGITSSQSSHLTSHMKPPSTTTARNKRRMNSNRENYWMGFFDQLSHFLILQDLSNTFCEKEDDDQKKKKRRSIVRYLFHHFDFVSNDSQSSLLSQKNKQSRLDDKHLVLRRDVNISKQKFNFNKSSSLGNSKMVVKEDDNDSNKEYSIIPMSQMCQNMVHISSILLLFIHSVHIFGINLQIYSECFHQLSVASSSNNNSNSSSNGNNNGGSKKEEKKSSKVLDKSTSLLEIVIKNLMKRNDDQKIIEDEEEEEEEDDSFYHQQPSSSLSLNQRRLQHIKSIDFSSHKSSSSSSSSYLAKDHVSSFLSSKSTLILKYLPFPSPSPSSAQSSSQLNSIGKSESLTISDFLIEWLIIQSSLENQFSDINIQEMEQKIGLAFQIIKELTNTIDPSAATTSSSCGRKEMEDEILTCHFSFYHHFLTSLLSLELSILTFELSHEIHSPSIISFSSSHPMKSSSQSSSSLLGSHVVIGIEGRISSFHTFVSHTISSLIHLTNSSSSKSHHSSSSSLLLNLHPFSPSHLSLLKSKYI